jgi:hypothetical protein
MRPWASRLLGVGVCRTNALESLVDRRLGAGLSVLWAISEIRVL